MQIGEREVQVLRLLGKGKSGYSYLVTDGAMLFVAKQIHHEPCNYYQFGDKLAAELDAYETLKALGVALPELLEVDHAREILVKEFIEGETVYDMVRAGKDVSEALRQMRALCKTLYAAGKNIDCFPTNFILRGGVLYYVDYEYNAYMEQWDFEHWGVKYWSKTPEFLNYAAAHTES